MDHIAPSRFVKGALMFTVALAINDAAKETIKRAFPIKSDTSSILMHWIYVVLVIVITIMIMHLHNIAVKPSENFKADVNLEIKYPGGVKQKNVKLGYI